jgi:hypothetical protein
MWSVPLSLNINGFPFFEPCPVCGEKPEWAQAKKIDVGASSVHPEGPRKREGMKVYID